MRPDRYRLTAPVFGFRIGTEVNRIRAVYVDDLGAFTVVVAPGAARPFLVRSDELEKIPTEPMTGTFGVNCTVVLTDRGVVTVFRDGTVQHPPVEEGQTDEPPYYEDQDGDVWHRRDNGAYGIGRVGDSKSLEFVEDHFGPLTPIYLPRIGDIVIVTQEGTNEGRHGKVAREFPGTEEPLFCTVLNGDQTCTHLRAQDLCIVRKS